MNGEIIDILDIATTEARENGHLISITKSYCENNSKGDLKEVQYSFDIISQKQNRIINLLEDFSNKLIREFLCK